MAEVSKYDLSGYNTLGNPEYRTYGNKQFVITQYQREHRDEYTVMEINENGQPNGLAQLFKNGIIQLSWRMINGKRNGKLTIYKNGVVDRMATWDSFKQNVLREVVNDKSGTRLLVEKMKLSGVVIYKGTYDCATLEKSGWGIEYDEDGVEKCVGFYKNDRLVHIKQSFVKEKEGESEQMMMIEYGGDVNENNVNKLVNRRPIYMGSYTFSEKKNEFIRCGIGYEINELSGICDKICEWDEHGEKKGTERELHGGWYGEGESDRSIRVSEMEEEEKKEREEREERERMKEVDRQRKAKEEEERRRREERESQYWNEELTMCPGLCLTQLRGIEELKIGNHSFNDSCSDISKMKMDLSKFKKLKRIEIGNSCFKNVRELVITDLVNLESVKIGENCFKKGDGKHDDGLLRITNCPNLRQLELGDQSFSDFKSFQLYSVDSLQSIKFCDYCFWRADDFSLIGE